MKLLLGCLTLSVAGAAAAQDLPARWDDLTASDWPRALEQSAHTCIFDRAPDPALNAKVTPGRFLQ